MREAVPSDMLAEPSSIPTPEQLESASSSAEHQVAGTKDAEKLPVDDQKKCPWPSVVEMNTRLRRLVTSYQRNFKKEEMKLAQKAKVWLVQHIHFYVHAL
jgi:chromodomain-helicase-DNA-binding protein 7